MTEFEEKRELYNKVQNNEIKLENLNDKGKKAYLTYGIDSGLIDKSKIDNDILKKYNLTDTITYNGVEYKKINKNEITPLMTQEQIKEKNNALTNFGNLGAKYNIPTDKVASLVGSTYAGLAGTLNNIGTNINAMMNNLTPQEKLQMKEANEKYSGITAARDYASTVAGDNTAMNFANQVAEGVGGMIPSMLVGGAAKLGGKALGLGVNALDKLSKTGYLGTMAASVQGATTDELLANGEAKNLWEAELKALPYTIASIGVEQLGGIGKESISKIANNLIRTFGEEAYEESLEGIIDRTLDLMIQQNKLKKQDIDTAKEQLKYVLDPKTIGQEALLGGTTALALGGSAKLTNIADAIGKADAEYERQLLTSAKDVFNQPTQTTDLAEQTKSKNVASQATKSKTPNIEVGGLANLTNQLQAQNQGTDLAQMTQANVVTEQDNKINKDVAKNGGIHQNNYAKTLKAQNETLYNALNNVAKKLNVDLEFSTNLDKNAEGLYSASRNKVLVDVNADNTIGKIAMHELTHRMQDLAPEEYKKYKKFVMETLQQNANNEVFKEVFAKYEQLYNAENELNINKDKIADEIISDFNGIVFGNDTQFIEKLAKENPTGFRKIVELFKQIINDIKASFTDTEAKLNIKGSEFNLMMSQINEAETRLNNLLNNIGQEQAVVSDDVKYSLKELNDGTKYVELDNPIENITNEELYKTIKNKLGVIQTEDGTEIELVNYLKNKDIIKELQYGETKYDRFSKNTNTQNLKYAILKQIDENIKASNYKSNKADIDSKHKKLDIESFDSRQTIVYDGKNIYKITFNVANINDGRKVAYAIQSIKKNNSLLEKLQKNNDITSRIPQSSNEETGSSSSDTIKKNISQTKENVKYSLKDSQGNELTKEQQEYFKDSKVRDENGNLMVVYHGTDKGGFTVFDKNMLGETTQAVDAKIGFHFTDNRELAELFSTEADISYVPNKTPEVKNSYLKIVKPFDIYEAIENNIMAEDIYYALTGENEYDDIDDLKDNISTYIQEGKIGQFKDELASTEGALERLKERGYDGLILPLQETDVLMLKDENKNVKGTEYIVFESNQIKNIDNLNPTDSDDIRYSLKERDKGFLKTASESEKLNEENRFNVIEKQIQDGTYQVKTNEETKADVKAIIKNAQGQDEYQKLDSIFKEVRDNKYNGTGLESALLTEVIEGYQELGNNNKVLEVIDYLDDYARQQGRSIQYLSQWKALKGTNKALWVKKTIEKYNNTTEGKKNPIKFDQTDAENLNNYFATLDEVVKQETDKTRDTIVKELKKELLNRANFNNKYERQFAENNLNNLELTAQEIKEKLEQVAMAQIFGQADSTMAKKIGTIQTMSHLINTSTFARNILSNESMKTVDDFSKKVGRLIWGNYGADLGQGSILGMNLTQEQKAEVAKTAKQKAQETALNIWLGIDGFEGTKYTNASAKTITGIRPTFKNETLNALEKVLGRELKVPDESMKARVRETIKKQYKNAMGEEVYKQYENEINKMADEEALYITFQDETWASEGLKGFKNFLNKATSKITGTEEFGLGDFVVKYTQVPGNIIARGIEYSPFGALKALKGIFEIRNMKKEGKITQFEADKNATILGRALTGTAISTLAILLAKMGIMTYNKEEDEDLTNLLKDAGITTGKVNASQIIRILTGKTSEDIEEGDILVDFSWLQPISAIAGAGISLWEGLEKERGARVTLDVLENFLDFPCNQSVATMFNAIQYKDSDQHFIEALGYGVLQAGGDSLAGFIPSVVRQTANALDPVSRNTYSNKKQGNIFTQFASQTIKKTAKNLPGVSKLVEPNIRPDGKEKVYFDGGLLLNALIQASPARLTKVDKIEGTDTIKEVLVKSDGESLAKTSNLPLRYAPNRTQYTKDDNGEYIPLTDKQKTKYMQAYSEYYKTNYVQYLGTINENATDKQKEKYAERLAKLNKYAKQYAEKKALEK